MSYFVEFAKSARAKCKHCSEPIAKGDVKLVTQVVGDRFTTTVSHHTTCFTVPRKYYSQSAPTTGTTTSTATTAVAAFVEDILEDATGGDILPAQAHRIATELETTLMKGKEKKKRTSHGDEENASPLQHWKQAYEAMQQQPPPKKKAKSKAKSKANVAVIELDVSDNDDDTTNGAAQAKPKDSDTTAGDCYGMYHKYKNEQLKDVLRWNRQVLTPPTKDMLLYKVIDGHLHGRLARCVLCGGGRLKLAMLRPTTTKAAAAGTAAVTVVCSGSFDEDTQRRLDCSFTCATDAAPRLLPWYDREPTEEEQEELDRIDTEAKTGVVTVKKSKQGGHDGGAVKEEEEDDMTVLQRAAAALTWNLQSREGLRTAAADMMALLQNHTGPRTIDLPMEEEETHKNDGTVAVVVAMTVLPKIGQVIAANRTKSASELVPLIVEQFGFKQDKQAKADRKQAALATIVACPENSALVAAFCELSDLYFKTGNANAGVSYKRVVAALASFPHPITAANAKGLGSGSKTKVANIGKSSADKIYEFVTTGTLQKLEEKRADAAS